MVRGSRSLAETICWLGALHELAPSLSQPSLLDDVAGSDLSAAAIHDSSMHPVCNRQVVYLNEYRRLKSPFTPINPPPLQSVNSPLSGSQFKNSDGHSPAKQVHTPDNRVGIPLPTLSRGNAVGIFKQVSEYPTLRRVE